MSNSVSLIAHTQGALRRFIAILIVLPALALRSVALEPIPDKTVVLTFDDAVKSQRSFVAPLLREHGFGATFFVTALWMADQENFMSWAEIAELHAMGFEIGNHSWSHLSFGNPKQVGMLAGQLALVESELEKVGVPKPISFAWCGNTFSPEGAAILERNGYHFARRGMQPEIPYGKIQPGPLYDPTASNPLLIPSAGDAYPDWTLEDFRRAVDRAKDGHIAVLQFHGVPDVAHPWVNTPPERFTEYLRYLKDNGFNVIALRDLARYVDPAARPKDAMSQVHYGGGALELPQEVEATRANAAYWIDTMMRGHAYTLAESASVFAWPESTLAARLPDLQTQAPARPQVPARVLPYPGGSRHPRIGFLDGAIDPLRGTKASVFAPWADGGYALVDLPEAIFSNLGLLFLAHTHVLSIWDAQHKAIENRDWQIQPDGALSNTWALPNLVRFGARVAPEANGATLDLWLENGTTETLTGLRTQICVTLKGMPGFNAQSDENKEFLPASAIARDPATQRAIVVEFDHCGRAWGNPKCPCIHADPVFPDCPPGQRVSVRGSVRFVDKPAQ